jgi:glycosyltransferase involved in cell wall biosynthesis
MVAPLLSGSGLRIKILEAMALGRPVLTTTTGIEGIPAKNLENVMVEDDPHKFKNLLIKLITEPKESIRLGAEGRKLIVREFDNFELSNRLSQYYKAEA